MSEQPAPTGNFGLDVANHVGIAVRDLDRSVAFYRALTGQEPVTMDSMGGEGMAQASGVSSVRLRFATFRLRNINIDLIQFQEPEMDDADAGAHDACSMHLCFEVEDFQAAYSRMRQAGIEFVAEPHTFAEEDGVSSGVGTQVVYFDDPDGTHLELIAPRGPFVRRGQS